MQRVRLFLVAIIVIGFLGADTTPRLAQGAATGPTFGQVTIAGDYADYGFTPIDVLDAYPAGLRDIVALLPVKLSDEQTEIDSEWFKDNVSVSTPAKDNYGAGVTMLSTSFHTDGGLVPGAWEVRYSYQGKVVTTGKFKVVATPLIYPFRFGKDAGHVNYEVIQPGTQFPAGTTNVSAVYHFYNLPVGQKGQVQWTANGAVVALSDVTFDGATGTGIFALHADAGLPSGDYELQVSLGGTVLQTGKVKVG